MLSELGSGWVCARRLALPIAPPFCLPPAGVPILTGCRLSSNPTAAGLLRVESLHGVGVGDLELTPLLWTDGRSHSWCPPAREGKNWAFPSRGLACPSSPFFLFWTLHW